MHALIHLAPSTSRKGFLHALSAALVVATMLGGCTAAFQSGADATGGPLPTPTTSPSQPEAFPRTVVDDEGTSITMPAAPQDIVSLTPANTEIVFALGTGDRLRGGTDFDDYPPEAVGLPDVATFTGVQIEQVVDIQPDLVLAGGNNFTPAADINRLRELGLPVLVLYAPTVEAVLADIRLIGRAIGADQQADQIVDGMESRIAEVTGAVNGLRRPRVFYEIGNQPEIFGPAPGSFVADMVDLAGGIPITTTDPAVFSISVERLVSLDPEVIVLGDAAYGVCPASVPDRPGWSSMTAVRSSAIRPVDDIIVTRPGPRLAEGLAALALAIHPEVAITPTAEAADLCQEVPPSP